MSGSPPSREPGRARVARVPLVPHQPLPRVERLLLSAALDFAGDARTLRHRGRAALQRRVKRRYWETASAAEVRSNHAVILSEASGFALRIRIRSRGIPALRSAPQPRQGVLPVPPCSQTMRSGRARVPLVPHQRRIRSAASAAEDALRKGWRRPWNPTLQKTKGGAPDVPLGRSGKNKRGSRSRPAKN
jgi:hypothetical protein